MRCFEGLKAYETEKGEIVTFRPEENGKRMFNTAKRLEMPSFPVEKFVKAVEDVVRANAAWVPPAWNRRYSLYPPGNDWFRSADRCGSCT